MIASCSACSVPTMFTHPARSRGLERGQQCPLPGQAGGAGELTAGPAPRRPRRSTRRPRMVIVAGDAGHRAVHPRWPRRRRAPPGRASRSAWGSSSPDSSRRPIRPMYRRSPVPKSKRPKHSPSSAASSRASCSLYLKISASRSSRDWAVPPSRRRASASAADAPFPQYVDALVQPPDVLLLTADLTHRQLRPFPWMIPIARLPGEITEKQSCAAWHPSAVPQRTRSQGWKLFSGGRPGLRADSPRVAGSRAPFPAT